MSGNDNYDMQLAIVRDAIADEVLSYHILAGTPSDQLVTLTFHVEKAVKEIFPRGSFFDERAFLEQWSLLLDSAAYVLLGESFLEAGRGRAGRVWERVVERCEAAGVPLV